jgi:hypothetical protein
MISVRCAALAAVLGAGLGGCSLVLDFDDPIEGPADAAPPDGFGAACDFGEPNEAIETAFALAAGPSGPAAICAGGEQDHDFYSFQVDGTQDATIRIRFDAGAGSGDLDLGLYRCDGSFVIGAGTVGDDEQIDRSGGQRLPAGDYCFEVFGQQPSFLNVYDLELTVTSVLADAGT